MNYYEVQLHFSEKWTSPDAYNDCYHIDHNQKWAYCPLCGRGLTGSKWVGPYRMHISSPKRPDVLWTACLDVLFSERFLELFEKEGLTGIRDTIEVEKYYRKQRIKERYFCPLFEYSQKGMDYAIKKNQELTFKTGCALCERDDYYNEEKYNLYFDDTLEYDLFKVYDRPGRIYCTERFLEFCRKYQIKNIVGNMVPSDTYLYAFCVDNEEKFKTIFPED